MIFEKFDSKKLEELLIENGIKVDKNYLLATRHRGLAESTAKLFASKVYNSVDASLFYLLAFDKESFYIARLSDNLVELFKRREKIELSKFPINEIDNFSISTKLTKHLISWNSNGKEYSFEIDKFQGIYGFVKENFKYLKANNFYI